MITKTITVKHKFGIHARPAAKIVSLCMGFQSDIQIIKEGEQPANAKNILDIMMLAAACGGDLELRADGVDEAEAMEQLSALMVGDFETNEI
jgi:phosphocarrier protein